MWRTVEQPEAQEVLLTPPSRGLAASKGTAELRVQLDADDALDTHMAGADVLGLLGHDGRAMAFEAALDRAERESRAKLAGALRGLTLAAKQGEIPDLEGSPYVLPEDRYGDVVLAKIGPLCQQPPWPLAGELPGPGDEQLYLGNCGHLLQQEDGQDPPQVRTRAPLAEQTPLEQLAEEAQRLLRAAAEGEPRAPAARGPS